MQTDMRDCSHPSGQPLWSQLRGEGEGLEGIRRPLPAWAFLQAERYSLSEVLIKDL